MFAQNFQGGSIALGCLGELGAGQACSERGFDQARPMGLRPSPGRAQITSNLAAGSLTSIYLGKIFIWLLDL